MASILVVDDQSTNREVLLTLLRYAGYRTQEACDGAEALALARAEPPDLVIADILMPTMDGYEFVRQLRADPAIAATPVVFYTATYLEREAHTLARKCGVSHILTKPMEPEAILRTVEEVLGLARSDAPAPVPPEVAGEHLQLLTDTLVRNVEELKVANQRLTALIDLGRSLALERDPQRLLESYCRAGREMIGARHAALGMFENNSGFSQWLTSGFDPEPGACQALPSPCDGLPGRLLTERRALRIGTLGEGQPVEVLPGFPSIQSFLGVPIATATRGYGFLAFGNKLGFDEFSSGDEQLAVALAAQLALAYENARRQTEVERHARQLEVEVVERRRMEEALRQSAEQTEVLSHRLLHAQEEERRRIAHELHDEVGQCLTAAKLAVDRIKAAPSAPTVGRRLTDASELIVRALDQVRDLSRLLRPSVLDDLGLTEAIRALVEGFGERGEQTAAFEADPEIGRLDPGVETACYRIAQEAVTNAVKHAGATRICTALHYVEAGLELVIDDDGVGFDVASATARAAGGTTLGLLGLRKRAALAGGLAEIQSRTGGGTRVRALFPVERRSVGVGTGREQW